MNKIQDMVNNNKCSLNNYISRYILNDNTYIPCFRYTDDYFLGKKKDRMFKGISQT